MKKHLLAIVSIALLSGCSVYKASDLQGATPQELTTWRMS